MSNQKQSRGGRGPRRNNSKKGLATDREISNAKARQRELQKWDDDSVPLDNEGLETGGPKKEWDQFEANKKFGYKSTFDMDLYTTSLDKDSDWYKQNERKAAQLAAQIEGKQAKNQHMAEERGQAELRDDDDEEERYSGVHRGGSESSAGGSKYVPPGKRSESPKASPPPQQTPVVAAEEPPKERKKLVMPSSEFKPSFSISFSPAASASPAAAAPPAAVAPAPVPMAAVAAPGPKVPFNRAPTTVSAPSPNAEGASISTSGLSFKDKLREAASKVVAEEQKAVPSMWQGQQQAAPVMPQPFVYQQNVPYGPGPQQQQYPVQMMPPQQMPYPAQTMNK